MQRFKESNSESELHEYCKYHFRVNHNGIAQLMYEMFRDRYAFVFNGDKGTWYKRFETTWGSVPGLEYELRNKISDEVYKVVAYSGWKPMCMDIDPTQALLELEFMLGTHEDKMAILREMEARFFVMEVPVFTKSQHKLTETAKVVSTETAKVVSTETAKVGPLKPVEFKANPPKNMNLKTNSKLTPKSSWKGSD